MRKIEDLKKQHSDSFKVVVDERGWTITDIIHIASYKKGVVVLTKNAVYTNVKTFLKNRV